MHIFDPPRLWPIAVSPDAATPLGSGAMASAKEYTTPARADRPSIAHGRPRPEAFATGRAFLELLAREAAAIEFESPVLEARARGADPAAISALEEAKLLGLRVRALLEQRRRREAELAALFETASDLAALRDLDAVLKAIVHRARQLLGTDVAYMTLDEPDSSDTVMRVTDGTISPAFQRVRLALGVGLGGLVAQTATAYATARYLDDSRFRHTQDVDAAVIDEGLVAILGVPLQLGTRVIGVLYAANRSERPFAREEVALLGSLAAHAAVAIDNARLLDETRAALEELGQASHLVREHSEAVERAANAHDRLADLVLRGGGVEDVAATVTEVIGGSLLVLDAEQWPLAAVGDAPDPGDPVVRRAVAASRSSARAVSRDGTWVAPVAAGTEPLGALVLGGCPELSGADQRILERAALVTALLLLFRRSATEAEGRVRGELLDDLLRQPDSDPDGLRERARRLGADLDRPHAVVVVDVGDADRQRAALTAGHLAATGRGLAGVYDGRVVVCVPDEDPGPAARRLCRDLASALRRQVTAGGAGPTHGPASLATVYREALRCVEALLALGRAGGGADARELGFLGLVLSDRPHVHQFVESTIGPVLAYDARRGTDLVRTLEAYFAGGGNLARTREALHVHVNTVTQRLERVSRLIGEDWQRPERMLEVQVALRLHRLSSAPEHP